jgi:hypothetical protein
VTCSPIWSTARSEIEGAGLDSLYLTQAFAFDALTALAVIGHAEVALELGTAVVRPTPAIRSPSPSRR